MRTFQNDWYSPSRLLNSPVEDESPGDRFIPNRSLMDLDQARSILTNKPSEVSYSGPKEEYRRELEKSLILDSDGRPFRIMAFRGIPKLDRKHVVSGIHEIGWANTSILGCGIVKQRRRLPKTPSRILDAPSIRDDYYINIMDWGKNNVLAIALGSTLYLWNSGSGIVDGLFEVEDADDYPTSVAWSPDSRTLAVGYFQSKLELWDAETSKLVRSVQIHNGRVGSLSWNGCILTSGSFDKHIINHDGRVKKSVICSLRAHRGEVCGLKWSSTGNFLASGGNDNRVCVWSARNMRSSNYLHQFNDHIAAVKSLAWCPYQSEVLASGGGLADGCIKLWNINNGTCINSIDSKAQVCGLEWNRHHKEILSGHGFSRSEHGNQLCMWRYPSMSRVGQLRTHSSRVLHLCQSPDGLTVVSAGADETLRFWDIFGPPATDDHVGTDLDRFLSLKISPIR